MALIVAARNISGLAAISNYEVDVFINEHCIWKGVVTDHRRDDGWATLLRRIADTRDAEEIIDDRTSN